MTYVNISNAIIGDWLHIKKKKKHWSTKNLQQNKPEEQRRNYYPPYRYYFHGHIAGAANIRGNINHSNTQRKTLTATVLCKAVGYKMHVYHVMTIVFKTMPVVFLP